MFPVRGYLLDISCGRIPTAGTFRLVADLLARCRYNQLQLSLGNALAGTDDPSGWDEGGGLASAELGKLDAYCRMQGIELVAGEGAPELPAARSVRVGGDAAEDPDDPDDYLASLLESVGSVRRRGLRPLFWGDVVLRHPALLARVPKDAVVLDRGYEGGHPFDAEARTLAAAGLGFYVCPGTSAWCSLAGRVENMRENLEAAERAGRVHGAAGYLVADWGGGGHWQPLACSLPGLVMGGAFAATGAKAAKMDLERELDAVMDAPLGGLLLKLGTLYLRGGALRTGCSELYNILANPHGYSRHPGLTDAVLEEIGGIAQGCRIAAERWADRSDWAKEIVYMANLVDCACHRRDEGRLRALRDEHGRIWRLRSREIGRIGSLAGLPRF